MKWSAGTIVTIVLTVAGWVFSSGVIYAHLQDTRARLERLEQKVDNIQKEVQWHRDSSESPKH